MILILCAVCSAPSAIGDLCIFRCWAPSVIKAVSCSLFPSASSVKVDHCVVGVCIVFEHAADEGLSWIVFAVLV